MKPGQRRGRSSLAVLGSLLLLALSAPGVPTAAQPRPGQGPFSAVSMAHSHACGLTVAGAADCWGPNNGGLILLAPLSGPYTAISAGFGQTCALTPAGAADCWGMARLTPTYVLLPLIQNGDERAVAAATW